MSPIQLIERLVREARQAHSLKQRQHKLAKVREILRQYPSPRTIL